MKLQTVVAAAMTSLVCACGSGGGATETLQATSAEARDFSAFCDSITGADVAVTSTIDPACVGCSVEEPAAVADDNAYSFATLTSNAGVPTQGASIRSTAQRTFAAGSEAGAFVTFPDRPGGTQVSILQLTTVRTFLGGAEQENSGLGRLHMNGFPGGDDLPNTFVSFTTTKPFDAVQLTLADNQFVVNPDGLHFSWVYKVYELCSNGGVSGPF